MTRQLEISQALWDEMYNHVDSLAPQEACGLVAGAGQSANGIYPITNDLHSSTRFKMNPAEQVNAMAQIAEAGVELLAIYHSHPAGPEHPSRIDLDEHQYPESNCLIWCYSDGSWVCNGYQLSQNSYQSIRILVIRETPK
jgi:proteasome lid subunit RPN8/RPN11